MIVTVTAAADEKHEDLLPNQSLIPAQMHSSNCYTYTQKNSNNLDSRLMTLIMSLLMIDVTISFLFFKEKKVYLCFKNHFGQ